LFALMYFSFQQLCEAVDLLETINLLQREFESDLK
jgi:hypothetical protein